MPCDAERLGTPEALARACRADAGDAGQPAVPGAVDDVEPLAREPLEVERVGDPRREAEDAGDRLVRGDADRDRAAHGEPDQDRPPGAQALREIEGRLGVRHARLEGIPALDPVAHLGESDLRVPRGELRREQLARRAPGSRNLLRRAAVRQDGGEPRALVPHARLPTGLSGDVPRRHAAPRSGHVRMVRAVSAARRAYPSGVPCTRSNSRSSGLSATSEAHSTSRTFPCAEAASRSTSLNPARSSPPRAIGRPHEAPAGTDDLDRLLDELAEVRLGAVRVVRAEADHDDGGESASPVPQDLDPFRGRAPDAIVGVDVPAGKLLSEPGVGPDVERVADEGQRARVVGRGILLLAGRPGRRRPRPRRRAGGMRGRGALGGVVEAGEKR